MIQPFFLVNTAHAYHKLLAEPPVAHFYEFQADAPDAAHSVAVPDGCVDIYFTFGGGPGANGPEGYACGMVTQGDPLRIPRGSTVFGVRYLPGYIPERLGVSIRELVNARLPVSQIRGGQDLAECVARAGGFPERARALREFLGDAYRTKDLLQAFIGVVLARRGRARVSELSRETFYSERYIDKVFAHNLGLSPKAFATHVRFQAAIAEMNSSGAAAAQDAGYFDQSHFIREFKRFTSVTPGEYARAADLAHYNEKIVVVR
jgi:AraC-like DNA-binding protein